MEVGRSHCTPRSRRGPLESLELPSSLNLEVMAVLLLRRQFVPPLADTAQDFCIKVTCERMAVEEGQVEEHVLLEEASPGSSLTCLDLPKRLLRGFIADSTAANTEATVPQQMYMDFIQAGPRCNIWRSDPSSPFKLKCRGKVGYASSAGEQHCLGRGPLRDPK